MTKEEASMIGFEIVAYSGDARSKLLLAVENAKTGNFDKCDGNHVEVGFITVHAQDHLMTTLLLKDIISTLIDVYKK